MSDQKMQNPQITAKRAPPRDGDLPLDTPSEGVMIAVRARGFDDDAAFWTEVCRLRQPGDAVRVFNAFQTAQPLRFPGDILLALMKMQPYPVPANRAVEPPLQCAEDGAHPGEAAGLENMNVANLPEECRAFELNTDWRGRPEFTAAPSGAFVRMLDQIALGVGSFHPPFAAGGVEAAHFPWVAVAQLSNTFPEPLALEVLRDWGVVLRKALLSRAGDARSALATAYQRTFLRWLVQRLAFERVV